LGFEITESRVKRAGLDYWPHLVWQEHPSLAAWQASVPLEGRAFYVETHAEQSLYDAKLKLGDWLVFGKETSGLSREFIAANKERSLCLPMLGPIRSLNLSNAVAVAVFEVLRQNRAYLEA
jgi:tRNA (cytidine/uridine-2'-O-)-methyltransferase